MLFVCPGTSVIFAAIVCTPNSVSSFRLSETEIEAWPKGKGANIFALTSVRRVTLCPDRDLIKLRVPLGGVRVYVPQEDFELLSDFLTEHLMGRAEFIRD